MWGYVGSYTTCLCYTSIDSYKRVTFEFMSIFDLDAVVSRRSRGMIS